MCNTRILCLVVGGVIFAAIGSLAGSAGAGLRDKESPEPPSKRTAEPKQEPQPASAAERALTAEVERLKTELALTAAARAREHARANRAA